MNVEPSCAECADRGWTLRYGQIEPCQCGTYDPPRWVTNGDRPCLLEHHKDPNRPRRAAVGWLCAGHYARFTGHLADLPALYDDLGEVLTASERHDTEQGTAKNGAKSAGLNLNEPIVEARRELHDECVRMVRDVAETRGLDAPTADTVPALASWLAGQAEWMAEQDDADDTYRYLDAMVTAAQRLAFPSGRRKVEIGACTQGACPGTLVAIVSRTADLLPKAVTCDTCAREIPSPEWRTLRRHLGLGDEDVMLTVAQACEVYDIPNRTLSRWVAEGRLVNHGDGFPAKVNAADVETLLRVMGVLRDSA